MSYYIALEIDMNLLGKINKLTKERYEWYMVYEIIMFCKLRKCFYIQELVQNYWYKTNVLTCTYHTYGEENLPIEYGYVHVNLLLILTTISKSAET